MHAVVTPLGLLKSQGLVGRGASEALEHLLVTALNQPNKCKLGIQEAHFSIKLLQTFYLNFP